MLEISARRQMKINPPHQIFSKVLTVDTNIIKCYFMKIIFFELLLICSAANAEWIGIMHKDHKVEYMLDTSKVTHYGSSILIPTLLNYKDAQIGADGHPYLSELTSVEYDCAQKRTRQHFIKRYSENLAAGAVVGSFDAKSDWENFIASPHTDVLQNTICRR